MATYYIDFNRGNDNNNGTSPSSAWQNLEKIDDSANSAGDMFLLADDSTWRPAISSRIVPPTSWTGTETNPIVIGKYSPSSQSIGNCPTVIWHHNTATSDWTETATPNIWQYSNSAGWEYLLSCLIRLGNTWVASAVDTETTPSTMSQVDGRYYASPSTSAFYLYAPMNPVTYYGSVKLSPGNRGYFTLSSGRGWVTIQDIMFSETGCGINLFSGDANTASYIVQRIKGRTVSHLINYSGSAGGVLRAWIRDCDIHDWGSLVFKTAGTAGMITYEAYRNRVDYGGRCWSQAAFYNTARATGFVGKIYDNYITRAIWGTRDKTIDGCAIYTETGSDQFEVFRNRIEDCYMALQDNSGRKATFYSNIINRCWSAMRVGDGGAVGSTDHNFINNTCVIGYPDVGPGQFGSAVDSAGVRVFKASGGAVALNIRNNIFQHYSGTNSGAAILLPQVSYTGSLDNNWFSGYANEAKLEFSPGTVVNTTEAGTGDPQLNSQFMPNNASTRGVGVSLVGRDYFGKHFAGPPSVGAVEYMPSRSATTRATSSRSTTIRSIAYRRAVSGA